MVYRVAATTIGLVALLTTAHLLLYVPFGVNPYRPDYSVFWTAAHVAVSAPGRLYDSDYVTAAQSWLTISGPRPWAYPPSALPLFLPLARLPFWLSLAVWDAISLAAFALAARRFVQTKVLAATLLTPIVALAMISGQTSLIAAAAILYGIAEDRPALSGLALGFAAAIKPQALILAPILLWGSPAAIASFLAAGAAMAAPSLVLAPRLWLDWIGAMPTFLKLVETLGLMPGGSSPASIAALLSLGPAATAAVKATGIGTGIALAFWSRKRSKEDRLVGLVGGGLLCSPYAMPYDLAALMPVAAAGLASMKTRGIVQSLPMLGLGTMFTLPLSVGAKVWCRFEFHPAPKQVHH